MIKAVTKLIIASAGLWLALPAAAQFEIDPDHFGDPAPTVVQPRPEQVQRIDANFATLQASPAASRTSVQRNKESSEHAADVVQCSSRPTSQSLWRKSGRAGGAC
jgi:hypothetical protein